MVVFSEIDLSPGFDQHILVEAFQTMMKMSKYHAKGFGNLLSNVQAAALNRIPSGKLT